MKLQVIWKKNRQHIKLLQILEWNTATESAHTETGDKTFWVGRKKRILVHLNGRLETLELEWAANGRCVLPRVK